CGRTIRRIVIDIERSNESPFAIRTGGHSHGLRDRCLARAHFIGSRRCPDRMPPRHCDAPLSHGAFWVLLGHGSENASRLFVEELMQQPYATSEFRLDNRFARYWEVHFPVCAQMTRFRYGRALDAQNASSP